VRKPTPSIFAEHIFQEYHLHVIEGKKNIVLGLGSIHGMLELTHCPEH
jgi:hypothetical protein